MTQPDTTSGSSVNGEDLWDVADSIVGDLETAGHLCGYPPSDDARAVVLALLRSGHIPERCGTGRFRLPSHTGEVMWLFGFPDGADSTSDLRFWWRTDRDPMSLYALCSDLFFWGTADLEPIEEADMSLLRECFNDLHQIDQTLWLGELFAARKRQMRPQGPFFDRHLKTSPARALFLAAGPERDDSPIQEPDPKDQP